MSKAHSLHASSLSETETLYNKTLEAPVLNSPIINDPTYTGETTIEDPEITGTITGSATWETPELDGPTFTATPITIPAGSTISGLLLEDPESIIGTVVYGGAAGDAGTVAQLPTDQATMADNTDVTFYTVTVPNAVHGASARLVCVGTLGDGDSTHTQEYFLAISRIAGAATLATLSSAVGSVKTTGATGDATLTVSLGAITGAVGVTQTFVIRMKIARSAGAADNHVGVINVNLMNGFAAGITIA